MRGAGARALAQSKRARSSSTAFPPPTGEDAARLARWLEARSASFLDWQADGSLIISTRFANVSQLHRVRAPLGMREQLTWSAEPITEVWSHPYDANLLLFGRDKGGDENRQIWLRNLAAGEERLLTDGKSRNGAPVFAHDGRQHRLSRQCARWRQHRHLRHATSDRRRAAADPGRRQRGAVGRGLVRG